VDPSISNMVRSPGSKEGVNLDVAALLNKLLECYLALFALIEVI
jgi:hypothetical protein